MLLISHVLFTQTFNSAYKPKVRDYDITTLTYSLEIDEKLYTVHNFQNDTNLNKHIILTRYESNGSVKWAKEYLGEQMLAWSVLETSDNHLLITGRPFISISPLSVRILKLDTLGTIIWSKSYSVPSLYSNTSAVSLSETIDGYTLFFNASTFNNFAATFAADIMVVQVDKETGAIYAQTALEGSSSLIITYAKALENNNFLIAGNLNNITNAGIGFLMEVSPTGAVIWKNKFIDSNIYKILFGKTIEHEGAYYQIGTLTYESDNLQLSRGYLMKINSDGSIGFTKQYKNQTEGGGIRFKTFEKIDSGFRIFGSNSNLNADTKVFAADINEQGEIQSGYCYNWGVSDITIYNGIGLGTQAGNEISGRTLSDGSYLFEHLSQTSCMTDDYNFSMMRTDITQQMQCTNLNETLSLTDSVITMQYEDFSAFAITPSISESNFTDLSSIPFEWERHDLCDCAFIQDNSTTSLPKSTFTANALLIYPNPSSGYIYVSGALPGDELIVYDMTGKELQKQFIETPSNKLPLNVNNGLYLIKVSRGEIPVLQKQIQVSR